MGTGTRDLMALARRQLASQVESIHHLELKALTLMGLDGALLGVVVAIRRSEGRRWWAALIGLGLSMLALWGVAAETQFDDGPQPAEFAAQFGTLEDGAFCDQLLADLQASLGSNVTTIDGKTRQLNNGFSILILTVVYSTFLFVFNR